MSALRAFRHTGKQERRSRSHSRKRMFVFLARLPETETGSILFDGWTRTTKRTYRVLIRGWDSWILALESSYNRPSHLPHPPRMLPGSPWEPTYVKPFGRVALLRIPGMMAVNEEAHPCLPLPSNPNEQVYTGREQGETGRLPSLLLSSTRPFIHCCVYSVEAP